MALELSAITGLWLGQLCSASAILILIIIVVVFIIIKYVLIELEENWTFEDKSKSWKSMVQRLSDVENV